MEFLTIEDFKHKITTNVLNQITDLDNTVLDDAEKQAIGFITDSLSNKYDFDYELAITGTDRHVNLLRWLLNLSLYFAYERIPANQVPERIVKNYDDTVGEISLIERGKKQTTLKEVINETTDKPNHTFRWGSDKTRTY